MFVWVGVEDDTDGGNAGLAGRCVVARQLQRTVDTCLTFKRPCCVTLSDCCESLTNSVDGQSVARLVFTNEVVEVWRDATVSSGIEQDFGFARAGRI